MQKRQTSGFSGCSHTVDTVHSGRSMQWTQYAVDIVFDAKMSNQWIQWMQSHSGHSTQWTQYAMDTVDIVFAKTSNQWIQWMQSHSGHSTQWMQYAMDAVRSGHSRIVVYADGDIVFDTKRSKWTQWMQYAVDAVCSGCSVQWTQ